MAQLAAQRLYRYQTVMGADVDLYEITIFATGGVLAMAAIGMDMAKAFGAVAAALGNIGSLGELDPTDNCSQAPLVGKWLLALFILLGRLEIFTVLVLFSPAFWRK